jgi:sodium pump decarboxylase gamma subunit
MELFRQAFTIMVLGMGLVFLFLYVLILAVQVAARVVRRIETTDGGPDEGGSGATVAAIAVALAEREQRKD